MYALTKKSLVITVVALSCVMMGHLILDFTSDHVADSSTDSNKSPVAINN